MISNTKSFYAFSNGSPFIDGLLNIKQVKSIIGVSNGQTSHYTGATYTDPLFYANVAASAIDAQNNLIISDPRPSDLLVFRIPKTAVASVNNLKTTYSKTVRGAIFTSGLFTKIVSNPETFALGDGVVNPSTARVNFIVAIRTGATANVPLGVWNFEKGTVTISQDSTILTIDLGDATFTGVADIEYIIESNNLPPRIKTRITDAYQFANVNIVDNKYSTNIADIASFNGIFKLKTSDNFKGKWQSNVSYTYNDVVIKGSSTYRAVAPSSNVAVTRSNTWAALTTITNSTWILSNGQKDGWYDHGYVQYVGSSSSLPGNVLITYDYYTHAGEGPCTVNSYPANTQIYTYTSVIDSKQYVLRDCLDFRPKRVNGSPYLNFETAVFPISAVNTEADVTYYLARIDRLYVTADSRNFENPYSRLYIEQGIESNKVKTVESSSDKSKLAVATLYIPPYASSSFDVRVVYEDSRRFTMNDISKLAKVTSLISKQVKIHTIEIANLKSPVLDDGGNNLLKTGILIENFADFTNADLTNPDFLCTFDFTQGLCVPLFTGSDVALQLVSASNYSVKDGIITQNYSEEIFASQLEANSFVNPNPAGISTGRGRAVIGKKNSWFKNLLIIAAIAFALLTAAIYISTAIAIGAAVVTISAAAAGAVDLAVAQGGAAVDWLVSTINIPGVGETPIGWVIVAAIVIDKLTGGAIGKGIKQIGDTVSDTLADVDDGIHDLFHDIGIDF